MDQQNDEDYSYNLTIPLKKVFDVLANASQAIPAESFSPSTEVDLEELKKLLKRSNQ